MGGSYGGPNGPKPPTRESEVLRPANMIALSDGPLTTTILDSPSLFGLSEFSRYEGFFDYSVEKTGQSLGASPGVGPWTGAGSALVAKAIRQRHLGRWNVAYADGHVLTQRTKDIFDYTNDEVLRLRNKDNEPHRELLAIP